MAAGLVWKEGAGKGCSAWRPWATATMAAAAALLWAPREKGAGSWLRGKGGSGEANLDFAREWIGNGLSGGEMARHGGTATAILVRRGGQGMAGHVSRAGGSQRCRFRGNRGRVRWIWPGAWRMANAGGERRHGGKQRWGERETVVRANL